MGLADLKNTSKLQSKTRLISIDEFIDGAEFYAKGLPESLAGECGQITGDVKGTKFKACTYTLDARSRQAIDELSSTLFVSKSKLVRIMLRNLLAMDAIERRLLVNLYGSDKDV